VSSNRRTTRFVPSPARLALGSIVACIVILTGGALPAFSATAFTGTSSTTTSVQVPERMCPAAAPGRWACFGLWLVTKQVSQTTARQLRADGLARPAALTALASGPAGGYSPGQIAAAYGVNPAAATSQTVAIVDAYQDPSVTADLDAFDAQYGLSAETSSSFSVVSQTGGSVSGINTDVNWAGEITLDVEAVRGLCHACKILLVEANTDDNADLGTATNYAAAHASIVSNSYGGPEAPSDPNVADYNHPGVAILAASGDDGWDFWDQVNLGGTSAGAPSVPASYNTVVGVGGTSLYLNPNSTRASETVWNDNGPFDAQGFAFANTYGITGGAAGSGCSSLYTAQTWQQDVAGYASLGCGATARNGVDLAVDADYFTGLDIYETTTSWCTTNDGNGNACPASDPGWVTVGGTSLSSPLVAAMWALAGGPANVKYPALTLYGHFRATPSQLYDVNTGGTGDCDNTDPVPCAGFWGGNPNALGFGPLDCQWDPTGATLLSNKYQCDAEPGYDGVSGVGTPKGIAPFQPISPTAVIQSPGTVTVGVSHVFSASGSSAPFPGDSITSYKWSWGDGTTTTTASPTTSHTYASTGTRTITLTVTDSDSSLNGGRTGSKSIQVAVQPVAQPTVSCVVPNVKGKTLLASKRALGQAHCQAGTITRKYSRLRKGRVISERPALGTHLVSGAKVALVVSKGKKPRR
jgi:hypothetical protein